MSQNKRGAYEAEKLNYSVDLVPSAQSNQPESRQTKLMDCVLSPKRHKARPWSWRLTTWTQHVWRTEVTVGGSTRVAYLRGQRVYRHRESRSRGSRDTCRTTAPPGRGSRARGSHQLEEGEGSSLQCTSREDKDPTVDALSHRLRRASGRKHDDLHCAHLRRPTTDQIGSRSTQMCSTYY